MSPSLPGDLSGGKRREVAFEGQYGKLMKLTPRNVGYARAKIVSRSSSIPRNKRQQRYIGGVKAR